MSWIDYFICDDGLVTKTHSIVPLYRDFNLSDLVPITITLDLPVSVSVPDFAIDNSITKIINHTDWQSVSDHYIINFKNFVSLNLLCSHTPYVTR